MPMHKRLTAEFFGTFWLVFGGCGSAVLAATFPNTGIGFHPLCLEPSDVTNEGTTKKFPNGETLRAERPYAAQADRQCHYRWRRCQH